MCKLSLPQFVNQIKHILSTFCWQIITPTGSVLVVDIELIIYGTVVVVCSSETQIIYISKINSVLYDQNAHIFKLYCAESVYTLIGVN